MAVIFEVEAPFRSSYQLHMLEYGSGGPVVSIISGLHGNELNGIHAVNLLSTVLRMQKLNGTIRLFPLVNTFGADECRKQWPLNNEDINKSFPGSKDGTITQRIIAALMEATSGSDICIDVHSGASHVREIPQVRCAISGIELEYARAMRLPIVWKRFGTHLSTTGFLGACRQRGQSVLKITGGRGITLDTKLSTQMADGLSSLCSHIGIMRSLNTRETLAEVHSEQIKSYRASCGGFFVPEVRVGDRVQSGRLLGYLQSPIGGERLDTIRAEGEGFVVTLRANPMVHSHELLVRLAYPD